MNGEWNKKKQFSLSYQFKWLRLTVKNRVTGSMTMLSVSLSSSVKLYGYGNTCDDSTLPRKKLATND